VTKTALVLGATGGVGSAVTRALLRRSWQVVALARDVNKAARNWGSSPAPRWLTGNAMERSDVIRAATGAVVIVHAVNPPRYRHWDRLVLPMIDNTIAAARAAGGARIVLPGTIYNYDPRLSPVIDETTPQQPKSRKGAIRVALERRLQDSGPEVPSLIVRSGDFFGPGAQQSWFAQALAKPPLLRILNPGRRGVGHAWAYLTDLAEAIAQLIELGSRLRPTERVQFAGFWDEDGTAMTAAIRRVAGKPNLPERPFPWWLMQLLAPFGGFPREVMEVRPHWRYPARLDNSRLVDLLGKEPHTPLDEAIETTLTSS
jgi:nucleoside-diphosphate-sugar epimerase